MARSSLRHRWGALAGAASLLAAPLVGVSPEPVAAAPAPPVPGAAAQAAPSEPTRITWRRCMGMQCGQLDVPLDHMDPSKGDITLDIARRPADDQKRKLGVLFVNPGGPGGSSVYSVPQFAALLGRDVRARFDIVGVDPRGIGGSELAVCEGKPGQEQPVSDTIFPWRDEHYPSVLAANEFIREMCVDSAPKILPYMTTADVARDMDIVRASLGATQLDYYGVSYGSYLGTTYANLFPDRVRTMVVDGVLDPVAWATGRGGESATVPTTSRIRSAIGAHEGLMAAIAECENVGPRFCVEHETIRDDWAALTGRLREASVPLEPGEEGMDLTYDLLVGLSLNAMYDPEAVPELLTLIHEFRLAADEPTDAQQAPPAGLRRAFDKVIERDEKNRRTRIGYDPPVDPFEEEWPPTFFAGFEGVLCSETVNPSDPTAWIASGRAADRVAPGFGPLWNWSSSLCAGWPAKGKNAYTGPFTASPAGGMMVMTTRHDPATPYSGARAVRALTPNSRMVTVQGWGHAALDQSGCATQARTDYLLSGTLPAKDLRCRPDHRLFTALD